MTSLRTIILPLATALLMAAAPAARGAVTVKAELDSAQLLMGRVTTLNVTLIKPVTEAGSLVIPADTMATNVEVVGEASADTSRLGNGLAEIRRRIVLQSFDSGLYTLRPVLFVTSRGDTIASGRPVLKVNPVAVDTLTTIHDYADVQDGERHFWDWLPDFLTDWGLWALLALLVVVGGIILYFRYIRKGKLPLAPRKKEEPPYELAVRRLNELKARHLCEAGREKEYYTDLTDILRTYIDSRFHINAMEMTSTQILRALESNADTRMPRRHVERVLEVADFVKFAAQRPLPDDNVKAFDSAMQFVEDTRPRPEENVSVEAAQPATNPTPKA
ncbi:MAG: cell wall anchor protein [Candidatus Amulumruptor caecigallinarius]|nr:cell wall anchor protein [Candidatus Amulumruptor caecigallinarius]MCM1396025.1 cell wall anchor protein [Candidatus Amulumruptor caecigallinarius]MCM1453024.1 cell wall anchor protein [bacterium]